MVAVLPGEYLLCCGISHGHMLSRAPAWIYPQPLMLQYLPAATDLSLGLSPSRGVPAAALT